VPRIHTRARPRSLAQYLAVMSRAIFQAGLSWALIDRQWDALSAAFDGFDPVKVARYGASDFKRLGATPGIVIRAPTCGGRLRTIRTMIGMATTTIGIASAT